MRAIVAEAFAGGTGGDVYFGVFEVEDLGDSFANSGRGAGDDEDAGGLVRDGGGSVFWRWGEELAVLVAHLCGFGGKGSREMEGDVLRRCIIIIVSHGEICSR